MLCVLTCVLLSAASAFIITTYLATGPLVMTGIYCAVGSGIMAAVLSILDRNRALALAIVLLAASLVTLPVLKRFELSKRVPYTAVAVFVIGFAASRIVYKEA